MISQILQQHITLPVYNFDQDLFRLNYINENGIWLITYSL